MEKIFSIKFEPLNLKKIKDMRIVSVIIIILISQISFAQSSKYKGGITSKEGERLAGFIKYINKAKAHEYVVFSTKGGKGIKYYPDDLEQYTIDDLRLYRSRNVGDSINLFVEVIIESREMTLCRFIRSGDEHVFIEKGDEKITLPIKDTKRLRGTLKVLLGESEATLAMDKLNNSVKGVVQVLELHFKSTGSSFVLYHSNQTRNKTSFGVLIGTQQSTMEITTLDKEMESPGSIMYGLSVTTNISGLSRRFYLESGVNFSKNSYSTAFGAIGPGPWVQAIDFFEVYTSENSYQYSETMMRIPVLFNYVLVNGVVEPFLALGFQNKFSIEGENEVNVVVTDSSGVSQTFNTSDLDIDTYTVAYTVGLGARIYLGSKFSMIVAYNYERTPQNRVSKIYNANMFRVHAMF